NAVNGSGGLLTYGGVPVSSLTGAGTGVLTALGNAVNGAGGLTTYGTDLPLAGGTITGALTVNGAATLGSSVALGDPLPIVHAAPGMYFDNTGNFNIYSSSTAALSVGVALNTLVNWYNSTTSVVGSVTTDGTTVSYNTTSDRRLKIDDGAVSTFDSGRLVDQLAPRWFRWKDAPNGRRQVGFFAQQIHRVLPWAVTRGKGRRHSKDFRPWQMDATKMVPLLVAEIQSLRARVARLESA
ncbi:MAG TPA: tail fiber domain-containing protein, partial [Acetobacteraceae bacterium]